MKAKRYAVLDIVRGVAVLNLIIYHAIWDLVYLFGFDWQWYQSKTAFIWQQCICWTFIFLSGFCHSLGRHRLKRGIQIFSIGLLITIVTKLIMPQNIIMFGVLTLIGSCTLLLLPIENILKSRRPLIGLIVSMVLFLITRNVNRGYLGFGKFYKCELPNWLYRNLATAYLGFPTRDFQSTDYFSIFPWMFLFVAGYFLYQVLNQRKWLHYLEVGGFKAVEWLGRHSLLIYIMHQPVLYLIFTIIF